MRVSTKLSAILATVGVIAAHSIPLPWWSLLENSNVGATARLRAFEEGLLARWPAAIHAHDGYYLIQFAAQPTQRALSRVTTAGARLHDYVPYNAYLAYIPSDSLARVRAVKGVWKVLPYVPALRISPELATVLSSATRENPALQGASMRIGLELFADAPLQELRDRIVAVGGVVLSETQSLSGPVWSLQFPAGRVGDLLVAPGVKWVCEAPVPETMNSVARVICGSDVAGLRYAPATYLYGAGEVVAVLDTGLDTGDPMNLHPDLADRLVNGWIWANRSSWSDPDGHGTHVTGSVLGTGVASGSDPGSYRYAGSHAGFAPEAMLSFHAIADENGALTGLYLFDPIVQAAYSDGARICNNSWGTNANGVYDFWARQADNAAATRPDMLLVFAAGNSGRDRDRNGVIDQGSIASPALAKNVLAVGASENDETGRPTALRLDWTYSRFGFYAGPIAADPIANQPSGLAAFSSRGPTRDGRIKPELVAPGTAIISTRSSLSSDYGKLVNSHYAISNGTSTAAPMVAGAAAVVRQHLRENAGIANPPAALVKAVLLASARDLSPGQYGAGRQRELQPAPNSAQGFGRLDVAAATSPRLRVLAVNDTVSSGKFNEYTLTIPTGSPEFRVVLVWTDPPGPSTSSIQLVNDLDLTAIAPDGSRHFGRLRRDNLETIRIANPRAGEWRFRVAGTRVKTSAQTYSLVLHWR